MPWLPVNVRVEERLCVVVGGGPVALRKARKLREHGAHLRVVAPDMIDGWNALEPFERRQRPFECEDLENAFLVVAATSDRTLNRRIAEQASRAHVLALVADTPEDGDLSFPATLRQGDLTVSFATDGAAPALAARLRREAASHYGASYATYCTLARSLRDGDASPLPHAQREAFFKAMACSSVLDLLADGHVQEAHNVALSLLEQFRERSRA